MTGGHCPSYLQCNRVSHPYLLGHLDYNRGSSLPSLPPRLTSHTEAAWRACQPPQQLLNVYSLTGAVLGLVRRGGATGPTLSVRGKHPRYALALIQVDGVQDIGRVLEVLLEDGGRDLAILEVSKEGSQPVVAREGHILLTTHPYNH